MQYTQEKDFVHDLEVMFENARTYNEEGSVVYNDANELEKVLKNKVKTLPPLEIHVSPRPMKVTPARL